MGLSTVLKAKPRQAGSSNQAGRLRREGFLPAVFYGPGLAEAQSLALDYHSFKLAFLNSEGNRSLYTLEIEGQVPQPVLLKDYQVDSVSRKVLHADFYRIEVDQPITVKVPLVLTGKPRGVEKGGQLQQNEREAYITAKVDTIPAELAVDVSSLGLGQALHFSQIPVPEGLRLTYSADLAVAAVVIPKGAKSEVEGGEEEAAK